MRTARYQAVPPKSTGNRPSTVDFDHRRSISIGISQGREKEEEGEKPGSPARRPAPGKELTKDYNVLEAGLSIAVHLDKGCYKGQETISRLITYNGVKQRLWGIKLSGQAAPGTSIMLDGKKIFEQVGVLTSYVLGRRDGDHVGLGYAKRHVSQADEVFIGDVKGTLVDVPFLSYTKL
ncbi:hypothetical protein GW17_00000501 [Ensete ventricosum]|nr:hypothetical protein GW17_00000501 [Ensete ventricosum]